jgi:TetR/AcrR family transcriptional repressor of nem operon
MARTKEFDREHVLRKAIPLFADKGYAGTSTEVLLRAMGISRQSMYDTFGDKRKLYLEALQYYALQKISGQIRAVNTGESPIRRLESVLKHVVTQAVQDTVPKCLGVSAICEFGNADEEIRRINDMASRTLITALEQCVAEAQAAGQIGKDIDARDAAQFILSNFVGILLAARAGAPEKDLHTIAALAIRNLR